MYYLKFHFKTANVWNGKEFGNVVKISLSPKSVNKEKSSSNSNNVKDEEGESLPVNLLDKEANSNVFDRHKAIFVPY